MTRNFTLEYWMDDEWYVGRIKEFPGIFSQGESLAVLEENIKDAYAMMVAETTGVEIPKNSKTKELAVQV